MSEEKKGFFARLVQGLTKTRNSIMSGFDAIFSGFSKIDDDFYEELEEVLVMADLGIHTTENIIEGLKEKVKEQHIKEPQECKQLLMDTIKEQMQVNEDAYAFEQQSSVSMVWVRLLLLASWPVNIKRPARRSFWQQPIHSGRQPSNS